DASLGGGAKMPKDVLVEAATQDTQIERANVRLGKKDVPGVPREPRELECSAPQHVCELIAGLGQTEDVKFSPNNLRLALAAYKKNSIAIFDLSFSDSSRKSSIILSDGLELSSPELHPPHGVDFLDDERIVVANRMGDATIFALPAPGSKQQLELLGKIPV